MPMASAASLLPPNDASNLEILETNDEISQR